MEWLSGWLTARGLTVTQFADGTGFNKTAILSAIRTGRAPGGNVGIEDALKMAATVYDRTGTIPHVRAHYLRDGSTTVESSTAIRRSIATAGVIRRGVAPTI